MYKWIDECIDGLLDIYGDIDIHSLYDSLNIRIVRLPEGNVLLRDKDALYLRNSMGMEIVYIKDNLDFQYEKFVLAHELGHALLHVDIYESAFRKELVNKGKFERQANYFAVRLLGIEIDPIEYEGMTIRQIAKDLHIAEESLEYLIKY